MKARALSNNRSVVGAVVAIVSLVLMGEAAIAQEAEFRATGYAAFVGVDPPYEFIGVTGRATQLGPFEGMRTKRDFGHTTVARTTLVGGGGDSIDLYSEIEWDKRFVQASGFYVITGGTGRFQGATGSGAESVGAFDPNTGTRTLSWDGIITY